ncbi:MAG: hypothetical protein IPL25_18545 [Saprospiraceae bacterium]|nr:hypothetical protein [Candidatus Vicinibacter affinis]
MSILKARTALTPPIILNKANVTISRLSGVLNISELNEKNAGFSFFSFMKMSNVIPGSRPLYTKQIALQSNILLCKVRKQQVKLFSSDFVVMQVSQFVFYSQNKFPSDQTTRKEVLGVIEK